MLRLLTFRIFKEGFDDMISRRSTATVAFALMWACILVSCSPDQETIDKFPRQDTGDGTAPFSELKRFELENGIYSMGYISRRDIADEIRVLADEGDPPTDEMIRDFDEFMRGAKSDPHIP